MINNYFQSLTEIFSYILPDYIGYKNYENFKDFNFKIPRFSQRKGISAFIRAKNEENKIALCLNSIIEVFDEIIVIDNQSHDQTSSIVTEFKQKHVLGEKIKLIKYPFSIARCGQEHNQTPERSVHSLAYFYNYSWSHCTYKFVFWVSYTISCGNISCFFL